MKKYIKSILFILMIFLLEMNPVNAAGNYTVSLSNSNVTKGKSVTLYIKANNCAGRFNVSSSDSTVASVSETYTFIDNSTYAIKVNTLNAGTATLSINAFDVTDYDNNKISGTKTLKINVASASNNNTNTNSNTEKSSDATLKSLEIEGITLSPEFKSDTLEYSAEAEAGVEKVNIKAKPNDSKANVSGTGEVSVSDGTNKLEIIVAAEDGSTKSYIINLNVKEYDPITIRIGKKNYTVVRKFKDLPEVDLFEQSEVEIGDEKVEGYYNEKLNIYLIGLKDEEGNIALYTYDEQTKEYMEYRWITVGGITLYLKEADNKPENFKKYKTTIRNTKVDIYKINKKEKIGLVYGTNVATNHTGYYLYDEQEETLARYYNKEVEIYKDKIENYRNYLMILMGIISIIIIIAVIISLVKTKKRKKRRKLS